MEYYYTREIIKNLYKVAKYKQITELFSFVIKVEKNINLPIINKIFTEQYKILSLNAAYWNKNNPEKYYRISSSININTNDIKEFDIKKIRKQLVDNIYKEIIKKEIMMI